MYKKTNIHINSIEVNFTFLTPRGGFNLCSAH